MQSNPENCMLGQVLPEIIDSEMYWIHPDHLGSSSVLTNSKSKVSNWYEYMPYGESLMELSNRQYDNPYKYNGKELDSQTGLYYYGARYYDPQRSFWLSVDPLVEVTMSPYAYTWNDPVNYSDPTGMIGERIGDPGGPSINKIYGPKGGKLIEEIVLKGIKKPNIAHRFMQMSLDFDKGVDDGISNYTKDAYNFATKNAYSKKYWQKKGGEAFMSAMFISDMNKIRHDGSSNAMDVFNNISNASAYDVGHFTGYNGAQFVTTTALTEGSGFLLNSIRLMPRMSKLGVPQKVTEPLIDYTGGIDFSDPLMTFYHKGKLNGGILDPNKAYLSTGIDLETVSALNREGKVWTFEIQSSLINEWEKSGINFLELRNDLDHTTGIYNQEVRFKPATFPIQQNHIK